MQGRPGRFRSVTQFVEWRLRRTWRNRRGSAAWAAVRSGTASCTIAAGVRAGDDVAEVRRHFLNAKHAGCRRLRRSRCAALDRRLRLTVRGCHLRGGRRSRENKCRNDCELLHIGRLRALFPRQEAGQGAAPPTDCRSGSHVSARETEPLPGLFRCRPP